MRSDDLLPASFFCLGIFFVVVVFDVGLLGLIVASSTKPLAASPSCPLEGMGPSEDDEVGMGPSGGPPPMALIAPWGGIIGMGGIIIMDDGIIIGIGTVMPGIICICC